MRASALQSIPIAAVRRTRRSDSGSRPALKTTISNCEDGTALTATPGSARSSRYCCSGALK